MNYYHPETLEHIRNPLPAVAEWATGTELSVPAYDPLAESCRFVAGAWVVEINQPAPPAIPSVVTMRQARLALLATGKLADVDTVIAAMPEPDQSAAKIEWEYATEVKRDWPTLLTLAPLLGLSDADVDQLFIDASTR